VYPYLRADSSNRDNIMGSPFQGSVDFVDHSAELYELPTKVSWVSSWDDRADATHSPRP
jgi:hypothetical protein